MITRVDKEQFPRFHFPCGASEIARQIEPKPGKYGSHHRILCNGYFLHIGYERPGGNIMRKYPRHKKIPDDHEDHPFHQGPCRRFFIRIEPHFLSPGLSEKGRIPDKSENKIGDNRYNYRHHVDFNFVHS